jgi:dethiobiotin synthetase
MTTSFVIAGTDTDVGKTVFAAALAGALGGFYWKPIQSGMQDGGDAEIVARLSGLPRARVLPEAHRLSQPLSPHRAAELDGTEIDVEKLESTLPGERPLVVELAGGLLVPLSRKHLQVRLLQKWEMPVILVARTALGTINHSLLSIFALRMHEVPIHGIAFVGDANEDSERTICEFGQVKRLGRLPLLDPLNADTLRAAFAASFRLEDFA